MAALVAVETLLLVLLTVVVAGLLRSHAEILRRLGPTEAGSGGLPEPGARSGARDGRDVAGVTLAGDALMIGLGDGSPPTMLAFLSSGCAVCDRPGHSCAGAGRHGLPAAYGSSRWSRTPAPKARRACARSLRRPCRW